MIVMWDQLPGKIPAHYNVRGEVDRWGEKWELVLLAVIGGFTLGFLQLVEKFPEMHNYPKRLNESNAAEFYLASRKMVNQLKAFSAVVFSALIMESATIGLGWTDGLSGWFLPVALILLILPIVNGIIKQRKIK